VRRSPEVRGAVAWRLAAVIAVSVGVNEQAEEEQVVVVEDIARCFSN